MPEGGPGDLPRPERLPLAAVAIRTGSQQRLQLVVFARSFTDPMIRSGRISSSDKATRVYPA